jgi:hypothetical protein
MARRPRTPNTHLAALMQSGGIGNAQLARRVNAAGRELGLRLHYDKTSVSHWLAGSVPKTEAQPAVTEALSRLLGRPVTSAEAGWKSSQKPTGESDFVAGVIDLSRADMDPTRMGSFLSLVDFLCFLSCSIQIFIFCVLLIHMIQVE